MRLILKLNSIRHPCLHVQPNSPSQRPSLVGGTQNQLVAVRGRGNKLDLPSPANHVVCRRKEPWQWLPSKQPHATGVVVGCRPIANVEHLGNMIIRPKFIHVRAKDGSVKREWIRFPILIGADYVD